MDLYHWQSLLFLFLRRTYNLLSLTATAQKVSWRLLLIFRTKGLEMCVFLKFPDDGLILGGSFARSRRRLRFPLLVGSGVRSASWQGVGKSWVSWDKMDYIGLIQAPVKQPWFPICATVWFVCVQCRLVWFTIILLSLFPNILLELRLGSLNRTTKVHRQRQTQTLLQNKNLKTMRKCYCSIKVCWRSLIEIPQTWRFCWHRLSCYQLFSAMYFFFPFFLFSPPSIEIFHRPQIKVSWPLPGHSPSNPRK